MQAHVTELTSVLQAHLPWHKARLTFFARFVLALLQLGTVNLTKVALALNPEVRSASNYRRIQRFLSGFALEAGGGYNPGESISPETSIRVRSLLW